jgi:hypothetical protein
VRACENGRGHDGAPEVRLRQLIQDVRSGVTEVVEVPDPVVQRSQILVASCASLISAGTERYVVDLARKSLLGKALSRPDHVKRLLQKIRQEGLRTAITQAQAKLNEPMPLGYSSAGIVLACGDGVSQFRVGDRVAIAGPQLDSIWRPACPRKCRSRRAPIRRCQPLRSSQCD